MLCDVLYCKPSKITDYHDFLTVIYKDLVTQKKEIIKIKDPKFTIFEVKEEYRTFEKPRQHLPIKHTIPHEIKYKDLFKEIAKIAGGEWETYYKSHKSNYERRYLFKYPYILGADIPIETYYRVIWDKQLGNDLKKDITCQFMDIEVNQKHWDGAGIPRHGECPIDAVSLVDDSTNTVYTFLLRVPDNPLIDEFIDNIDNVQKQLHEMFDDIYGVMTYNIYMFDSELEMLHKLFTLIHSLKRDFVMIWNMSFDIPYLIERIRVLGYNPEDIICHKDFKRKFCHYFVDERMKNEFAERGDYALISSYTTYIDQMIQYASRRKGQGRPLSFSLDYIGELVAKVKKLDYKHITTNISELPYKDYKTFVFYNIMDVIVQVCIEKRTGDIEYMFSKAIVNNTRYAKVHRQTVYLTNRGMKEFDSEGFIIGNNTNKFNPKPDNKFPGAYVAAMDRIKDTSKMKIGGIPIRVFENLDDFDKRIVA